MPLEPESNLEHRYALFITLPESLCIGKISIILEDECRQLSYILDKEEVE